jgi:uncharacterized membrane protein
MESKPEPSAENEVKNTAPEIEAETPTVSVTKTSSDQTTTSEDHWEDHKVIAIVGYILPILFFIPLINEDSKNSLYARFHSGQQLNLLLTGVAFYLASGIIMGALLTLEIGTFVVALIQLIPLFLLALGVIGILSASKGEMKVLPLIGGFKILK